MMEKPFGIVRVVNNNTINDDSLQAEKIPIIYQFNLISWSKS